MAKGIYKLTNDRTGEVYVGQARDLEKRENRHFRELANGKHHNSGMQKDHNRGDTFTFEVLEELPDATKADLYNAESKYIKKYNCFREGYNQTPGGAMDQFKGRYEFGGGRLPLEKYKPTDKYEPFDISYCSYCGNKLDNNDEYCDSCGEKIDNSNINSEENSAIELESKKDKLFIIILIIIVLCAILGPILLVCTDYRGILSLIIGIVMLIGGFVFLFNNDTNETFLFCLGVWCIFFSLALLWEILLSIMY